MSSAFDRLFSAIPVALVCWFIMFSIHAFAQSTGQNAVYNSLGSVAASNAFVDASQFTGSVLPNNFCTVLNYILNPINGVVPVPSLGTVIDARGLNVNNTTMTCTTSPWGVGTGYLSVPSTILLPAGTIVIPSAWVLPNNTRILGEGDGIFPSGAAPPATTIRAINSFASGYMIQFGSSLSGCCTGISVENLVLDGNGESIGGIVNQYAQDFSYVDHVGLYQIRSTGLLVTGSANGSGPYSNLTFDTGSYSGTSSTVCASINGTTSTRGIRGLSCTSETNDALAAVLLDGVDHRCHDALSSRRRAVVFVARERPAYAWLEMR